MSASARALAISFECAIKPIGISPPAEGRVHAHAGSAGCAAFPRIRQKIIDGSISKESDMRSSLEAA